MIVSVLPISIFTALPSYDILVNCSMSFKDSELHNMAKSSIISFVNDYPIPGTVIAPIFIISFVWLYNNCDIASSLISLAIMKSG